RAKAAEAARVGNRRDQFRPGERPHPRLDNRRVDAEKIAQEGARHSPTTPFSAGPALEAQAHCAHLGHRTGLPTRLAEDRLWGRVHDGGRGPKCCVSPHDLSDGEGLPSRQSMTRIGFGETIVDEVAMRVQNYSSV